MVVVVGKIISFFIQCLFQFFVHFNTKRTIFHIMKYLHNPVSLSVITRTTNQFGIVLSNKFK